MSASQKTLLLPPVERLLYLSDSLDMYNLTDTGGTLLLLPAGAQPGDTHNALWPDDMWAAWLRKQGTVQECLVHCGDGADYMAFPSDARQFLLERGFQVADNFDCTIENRHDDGDLELWLKLIIPAEVARRLEKAEGGFLGDIF